MTRNVFQKDLFRLLHDLNEMGSAIYEMLTDTQQALKALDGQLARSVIDRDEEINDREHDIEKLCMQLIARQQPLAKDLRLIAAAMKVITDMERVADQSADISEHIARMAQAEGALKPPVKLIKMFDAARQMFVQALNCFVRYDAEGARAVCAADDQVDALFSQTVMELGAQLSEDPARAMDVVDLMLVTKYLERIGDHATNIAEWAIYVVTAEHPDLNQHAPSFN